MNHIDTLKKKNDIILSNSKKIRQFINSFIDEKSFVETDVFFSSQNSDADNLKYEGVITGYATINDNAVYIIAQNSESLGGSFNKLHADKMLKCISRSINNNIPLISIIDSMGAQLTDGIDVLEGYGQIISAITDLMNYVPHISIIKGNAIGLMGMYASISDFIFMSNSAVLSTQPPLSLAQNLNDSPQSYLGNKSYMEKSLLTSLNYNKPEDLKAQITKIFQLLKGNVPSQEDNPNRTSAILNKEINADNLINALADKDSCIEMYKEFTQGVRTLICSINNLATGIIITDGIKLNKAAINKITTFIKFLDSYDIPLVSLVDTQGIEESLAIEQQGLISDCTALIKVVSQSNIPKLSVITNNAIGFGYVALASQSSGFDYTLAFPSANISPITAQSAPNIFYADELKGNKSDITNKRNDLIERYKQEEMNPYNSAKKGYIDNVIEPALLRPYIASALLMLCNKEKP